MYTDVTIIGDKGITNLTADQVKELQKVFDKHTEVEENAGLKWKKSSKEIQP